jgi:hypothetical protein
MKWNPTALRWEGNDSVLRDFDTHAHSARPALITHLTGSSVGGIGSPTNFLTNGARIVGNMIFDPSKMCWINRYADDESDAFAGIDDEDEDKDATWGKNRGGTIRALARSGAPSSGTPLETVAGSPARSATSRASHRHSASESDTESADAASIHELATSPTRRRTLVRGASTSPVPGVDENMVEACRKAELRHRSEIRGWYPSRRKQIGIAVVGDVDEYTEPDRSYLFDIRTLATRKY